MWPIAITNYVIKQRIEQCQSNHDIRNISRVAARASNFHKFLEFTKNQVFLRSRLAERARWAN